MRTQLQRLGAIVAVLLLLGVLPAWAESGTPDAFVTSIPQVVSDPPPLSPAGEKVVPTDPAFRRACLELIPALRRNIRLNHELTTRTRQWGEVLRIDFSMAAAEMQTIDGRINRLVFWRSSGDTPFVLIAVGEPLPPLPAPRQAAAGQPEGNAAPH